MSGMFLRKSTMHIQLLTMISYNEENAKLVLTKLITCRLVMGMYLIVESAFNLCDMLGFGANITDWSGESVAKLISAMCFLIIGLVLFIGVMRSATANLVYFDHCCQECTRDPYWACEDSCDRCLRCMCCLLQSDNTGFNVANQERVHSLHGGTAPSSYGHSSNHS